MPPRAINVRQYQPEDPRHMATIRLNYPKISAVAGPCGLWPEDLGPSINEQELLREQVRTTISAAPISATWRRWSTTRPTWCSRAPKRPAYTPRRTVAFEKYRKGTPTTTTYPEADKAKLSDTGK